MKKIELSVRMKLYLLITFTILFLALSGLFEMNSIFRLHQINQVCENFISIEKDFKLVDNNARIMVSGSSSDNDMNKLSSEIKLLTASVDQAVAKLPRVLNSGSQKATMERGDRVSSSFHEYQLVLDELDKKFSERKGSSSGDINHLQQQTSKAIANVQSISNEYFTFLLKDLDELARKYSVTPGSDLLKRMAGRLDEAGKILASTGGSSVLGASENVRNEIYTALADIRISVNNLLEGDKQLMILEEGTFTRLGRAGKNIEQELSMLNIEMNGLYHRFFNGSVVIQSFVLIILAILIIFYFWMFSRSFNFSVANMRYYLRELVSGRLPDSIELTNEIEFTEMGANLNRFVIDLKEKAGFAGEIGKGEIGKSYRPLSEDDMLGNALIGLEINLQMARLEEENHRTEEEKRRWLNEGLAKFAEILRTGNNDLDLLADNIIRGLVMYLSANQGGLFLMSDKTDRDQVLELTASFAYNRKKFLKKEIKPGEGILGMCALEKQTILLTELPEDYLEVTSGLGAANPNCLVLVPLKLEEELLGVIEVAAFQVFQPHEVDFLEKIAASIASTIKAVRINTRTSTLLVQSQKQAQELAEKEEEMRQNMEELQATQEESARREMEISGILNAINNSGLVIEFDRDGIILEANQKLLDLLLITRQQLVGKKYTELVTSGRKAESNHQLWEELREGKSQSMIEKLGSVHGKDIWLSINFTPLFDKNHKLYKILSIATDITESKIQETNLHKQSAEIARKNIELQSLTEAVDTSLIKCVFDPSGFILEVNGNFIKTTGYSKHELIGKDNRVFLKPDELEQFNKIWIEVTKDKEYNGVLKRTKPTGEEVWLMSTFTPVKDEKNAIYKIYYLGQDITEKKLKYKLLEEANKEIERLKKMIKE